MAKSAFRRGPLKFAYSGEPCPLLLPLPVWEGWLDCGNGLRWREQLYRTPVKGFAWRIGWLARRLLWRLLFATILLALLAMLLAACSSVQRFAKPITDWAEEPEFVSSIGVKLEAGRWTFTGGVDLGWIRVGVGGGCLLTPWEICWTWPGGGS